MKHKRTRQITFTDNLLDRVYRLFDSLGMEVKYDGLYRIIFHKVTTSQNYVISGVAEEVGDKVFLKIYYDHKNITLGYLLKDCICSRLAVIPADFPNNPDEFLVALYEITEVTNDTI